MRCSKIQKALTEDLSAAALSEIRKHLEDCCRCRELLEDLRAIDTLNRSLPKRTQAPADFGERVICGLSTPKRRRATLTYLMLVPAVVLLAGIGWNLSLSLSTSGTLEKATAESFDAAVGTEMALDGLLENSVRSGATNSDYVEVIVEVPDGAPFIIRIPSTIQVREANVQSELLTLVSY